MNSFVSFSQNFFDTLFTWAVPSFFKLILIVVIAFVAKWLIDLSTDNFLKRLKNVRRAETVGQIIHSIAKVVIITIAVLMILNELGFDVRPIIAGAGILSLAVSLGAQHLVKDIVNGFFILFEDQFAVGDKVKIGDHNGTVERMNLRTTTLKDLNGNVHIIPNGEIKQVTVIR